MSLCRSLKAFLAPRPESTPERIPLAPPHDPLARFHECPEKLLLDFDILAFDQGLLATMQTGLPIDAAGAPIPWYTYPAIEYLRQFDFGGRDVFEYGCGNSSLFWASRGARVWSVDHSAEWHAKMAAATSPTQTFYLGSDRAHYLNAIQRPSQHFDVVVIDGQWREDCVAPAVAHLKPGGFIILDNSDRDHEAYRRLRDHNFFAVDFNGFGPINDYTWTTSIFLPPGGSQVRAARPPLPVGGHPNNRGGA